MVPPNWSSPKESLPRWTGAAIALAFGFVVRANEVADGESGLSESHPLLRPRVTRPLKPNPRQGHSARMPRGLDEKSPVHLHSESRVHPKPQA